MGKVLVRFVNSRLAATLANATNFEVRRQGIEIRPLSEHQKLSYSRNI
jgi:hypothetical protein